MSHAVVLVLIPNLPANRVNDAISTLMAPYSEDNEVDEYERDCHCLGRVARGKAREIASARYGTIDDLRQRFVNPTPNDPLSDECSAAWSQHLARFEEVEREALTLMGNAVKAPDPECISCYETGRVASTYNPKSKWDWWDVGGRWSAILKTDYEPDKDPRNFEQCFLCHGSGRRDDELGRQARANNPIYGCNGCSNTGYRLKSPSDWIDVGGNMAPVPNVIEYIRDESKRFLPLAVLTPDGEWHERGRLGWFGIVADERPREFWREEVIHLLEPHPNYVAVVIDYHI